MSAEWNHDNRGEDDLFDQRIAYFSMEIGLEDRMPTYSGGLGVLAGDTLRSAADRGLPVVAMTLLYRKGYFHQELDDDGSQREEEESWKVEDFLEEMKPRVSVSIGGQTVALRCWRKKLKGVTGAVLEVYFLDADLPDNGPSERGLTDALYGDGDRYRLSQEVILGIGGVRMLNALGFTDLETYHLNEGHSSLLIWELASTVARAIGREQPGPEDIQRVREQCVFTTHTPVQAGHDRFSAEITASVLGTDSWAGLQTLYPMEELNMTELALRNSRYVNGVAQRHGDVTRNMFNGYTIEAITNGVHAGTWVAPSLAELFDRHVPVWREDNQSLRYVSWIPTSEIGEAHARSKQTLLDFVREAVGVTLESDAFTIGFARRATAYKRAALLFDDIDRLNRIAERFGALQLIYAGKAHPADNKGKEIIRRIFASRGSLSERIQVVYLPDYSMELGGIITAGSDLWLNTPEAPKEASGTSGMKAALNGVPSLSVLDGWWVEGHIEGVTGWSIGDDLPSLKEAADRGRDSDALYRKLEEAILPRFYNDYDSYLEVRRAAIALNGSFFNTERMVSEYARRAYGLSREI